MGDTLAASLLEGLKPDEKWRKNIHFEWNLLIAGKQARLNLKASFKKEGWIQLFKALNPAGIWQDFALSGNKKVSVGGVERRNQHACSKATKTSCGQSTKKACRLKAKRKPWTIGKQRQDHELTELSRKLCYSKPDTPNLLHNKENFDSNCLFERAWFPKKKAKMVLTCSRRPVSGSSKPEESEIGLPCRRFSDQISSVELLNRLRYS